MDNTNLRFQERKLLDVKMWLWYRIESEGDQRVRTKMFEVYQLVSFAALGLEVVNFFSNEEYNDENSIRSKAVNEPKPSSGFK